MRRASRWILFTLVLSGCATSPLTGERLYLGIQDDTFRQHTYLAQHPNVDERIRRAILHGEIRLGMTQNQVIASWGNTGRKNLYNAGHQEQWVYAYYYLYFDDGFLVDWQQSSESNY